MGERPLSAALCSRVPGTMARFLPRPSPSTRSSCARAPRCCATWVRRWHRWTPGCMLLGLETLAIAHGEAARRITRRAIAAHLKARATRSRGSANRKWVRSSPSACAAGAMPDAVLSTHSICGVIWPTSATRKASSSIPRRPPILKLFRRRTRKGRRSARTRSPIGRTGRRRRFNLGHRPARCVLRPLRAIRRLAARA